jgi:hypothetical protein
MRYRIEVDDARQFLRKFFESLLGKERGNVEAAIHLARLELKNHGYPSAYSAPVIFSVEHTEPLFPFLTAEPPPPVACQAPEGEWKVRDIIWKTIESMAWESRSQEFKSNNLWLLKQIEDSAIGTAVQTAPLIMPEVMPEDELDWLVKKPGELINLPVKLYGAFNVNRLEKLEGQLVVDREDVAILGAKPSKELEDSGYEMSFKPKGRQIVFTIEPSGSGNTRSLQNMKLFQVNMQLGTAFATRYSLAVSGIKTAPQMKVCPGTSAVIVPPPSVS